LLHHNLYHQLLHPLNQITQTKTTPNPLSPHLYIAPLIHQPSFHNITHYIHLPKHQPPLITPPTTHHSQPYFIHPTIFPHLEPTSPLIQQQIFPPLFPFSKLSTFHQPLHLPNNTQYP
ncbi:aldehyde dehydrogenase family protein, partial [Bacillus sp. WP8]|uniref:aldehyde dehydrogenase family protein n=1 Tax=Bacillus sp. WP8 TaxID=756828 RepID=UPI00119F759C